ncbi:MAG: efflux RND transporter periplasmic adaptor subunit [Comamonas sp.]|nr:efflux RND transporter periplasmic adaptor subunit [Comamonas sp.]
MRWPKLPHLKVLAVLLPLGASLLWVALRTGPMAPTPVTAVQVQNRPLAPQLFGLGTVQARQLHKLGPTVAGRVLTLAVDVGDAVQAGQVLGTMDPVDLDERIRALDAAQARAQASVQEAQARQTFAAAQVGRYAALARAQASSAESLHLKRQELDVAQAALTAARHELQRRRADAAALRSQRRHLQLVAPEDAIVTAREAEPGSTVVAGQAVLELVAPGSVWIHLRLDQSAALGLAAGLPAHIRLRSRGDAVLPGHVLRVEPHADSVTEELLAKVAFTEVPAPLPPLGELAEVTLNLPALPPAPVIPVAAVQRQGTERGVWQRSPDGLRFTPVVLGRSDLAGNVQVLAGLQVGDTVVVHSAKALRSGARVQVVDRLAAGTTAGAAP